MIAAMALAAVTPADARIVVEQYYQALDRRDYAAAYRQWDRNGAASGKRFGHFVHGFARTAHVRVTAGRPADGEGAAGSAFITVPVDVRAVLTDGSRQRFVGSYTLRRVNNVPGSTAAQRRWHLASAQLYAR